MSDILLTRIGHLTTNDGDPVAGAAVAIDGSEVVYAGPESDAPSLGGGQHIDCEGRAVIPGFVDAHTHLVFGGERSEEFARRLADVSYAEIASEGGGILSTVEATRSATEEELFELAAARVWRMIGAGTTTVEIKSGYGLTVEAELAQLRVARRIGEELPVTVKTTFLGAHSVPKEFKGDRDGYVGLVISEMIPVVSGLADYCDVFVEDGVFGLEEARKIFVAATEAGMGLRVHAEQLSHFGGAALAAELGAASADHLDRATESDAAALAAAGVAAVLVPGASYTLRGPQAPGAMLAAAGCTIALATDCNPGTSYFESMAPIISLAVVQMGLETDQALEAATLGGAKSLGLDGYGTIRNGSRADLVVLDAPNPAHIPYRPGTNLAHTVISGGRVVKAGYLGS